MDTITIFQPAESAPQAIATPAAGNERRCGWCLALLKPRQQRWCSRVCGSRNFDRLHPRINPPGLLEPGQPRLSIKARLLALMADGHQRLAAELARELRIDGGTCARELRKLRQAGAQVFMARLQGPARPAVFWMPASKPAE